METDYDGEMALSTEVVQAGDVALLERVEIDMQIATAHRFPRSVERFVAAATMLATVDEETAESCWFNRPVGRKRDGTVEYAEGPSVRMAEIVAGTFGNLRVSGRITEMTPRYVRAQGLCLDLENNVAITAEVVESTVTSSGNPYSERMRLVVAKAALSKAIRDAIFRVVPRAICRPIIRAARDVALGRGLTMDARRSRAMEWIAKLGIAEERVFVALGVRGPADLTIELLTRMSGIKAAIKEGEIAADEAFPPIALATDGPTEPNARARAAMGIGERAASPAPTRPSKPTAPALRPRPPRPPVPEPAGGSDWYGSGGVPEAEPASATEVTDKAALSKALRGAIADAGKARGVTIPDTRSPDPQAARVLAVIEAQLDQGRLVVVEDDLMPSRRATPPEKVHLSHVCARTRDALDETSCVVYVAEDASVNVLRDEPSAWDAVEGDDSPADDPIGAWLAAPFVKGEEGSFRDMYVRFGVPETVAREIAAESDCQSARFRAGLQEWIVARVFGAPAVVDQLRQLQMLGADNAPRPDKMVALRKLIFAAQGDEAAFLHAVQAQYGTGVAMPPINAAPGVEPEVKGA